MEHHPLLSVSKNQMEITYSDLKKNKEGKEYTSIYFERPNGDDFVSARFDFPGDDFAAVNGIGKDELDELREYATGLGNVALSFLNDKEEADA